MLLLHLIVAPNRQVLLSSALHVRGTLPQVHRIGAEFVMKNMKNFRLVMLLILAGGFLFAGCQSEGTAPAAAKGEEAAAPAPAKAAAAAAPANTATAAPAKANASGGASDKVKLEFYVMSQCPYGTQVGDAIKPVLAQIGDNIDFQLNYIANPDGKGGFSAMHGQTEVDGNIWQLCAIDQYPENYKYMDFVECANKGMRQIPTNSESCAQQSGMDVAKLKACATGERGKELMTASSKQAQSRRATGSPTIFLANQPYKGGRTTAEFMRSICGTFTGAKPQPCADLPEPPKVNAVVFTDKRCKACQSAQMLSQVKRLFPGLQATTYEYTSPEGKAKYDEFAKTGELLIPAILFDDSVKKGEGYARISRYLLPRGEYSMLRLGAKWNPAAEICDNKADDTGNGKVDCDDPTCADTLACREEKAKQLDVFVMSQCPFGVRALDAMDEVITNFGDEMNFNIHFIADVDPNTPSGFKALHGEPEVLENIREICATKHYSKNYEYMDYILCRNKNIRSADWKSCTGAELYKTLAAANIKARSKAPNGIKAEVIEKCATGGEGTKLHAEDIKIAKGLGIGASPTWLANNRNKFSGVDPNTIKTNFCKHNPGVKNCDKKLSGPNPAAGPAGGCGQ